MSAVAMPRFKNKHLSVSRLKRFEQCPHSFELHYVKGLRTDYDAPHLLFGTLLHACLEDLFRWIILEEYAGAIPCDRLLGYFRERWSASGLTGIEMFQEGLKILRGYCAAHPEVDHFDILCVEREFNITLEEFVFNGRIDRADKVDDETVEIVDYKSNRVLFSRDELDVDLQMSIYGLVARDFFPWAKRFRFAFHMLRHGVVQRTTRTAMQIADARDYVVALGRQTETASEFPARLNPNCGYCDHRGACEKYQQALMGKAEITKAANLEDLAAVVTEREQVGRVAKMAYARQKELDDVIKARLQSEDALTLAGFNVRMAQSYTQAYPYEKAAEAFQEAGIDRETIDRVFVGDVSKSAVEKLLELAANDPKVAGARLAMLRAKVESLAMQVPFQTKLDIKVAKTPQKVAAALDMGLAPLRPSNGLARPKKA